MSTLFFNSNGRRSSSSKSRPRRGGSSRTGRTRRLLELEPLESRALLSGTWSPLTHAAPGGIGTMMLEPDGTVLAQGGGTTNVWYHLTPDASGSYVNGTWSQLASMNVQRLYFASNVLQDGRVLVVGGEYSSAGGFTRTGEIYNPVTNTWTATANFPQGSFGDDPSEVLPDGTVLTGYLSGPQTYIYNPTSNTWTQAATKLDNDRSDEETWLKLPDNSILSYDVFDNGHAQRYIPSTNQWVEAGTVPVALSSGSVGSELGPAFLLPDGRAFYIGANGNTAFYTPSTNSWTAGPVVPSKLGADDAPGAELPNGKILFAADTPLFHGPTSIFEFDPTTNTYTNVTPASNILGSSGPSFVDRMLVLPTGQILTTNGGSGLAVYTPDGSPVASGQPTISGISENPDGSFLLTGTQLNGISEGASYGDDAEMASNYPIVSFTDPNGNVYYARTYNWSSTGVATGSTSETTDFTLPLGLPANTYSVAVVANGIVSNPFSLTTPTSSDPAPTVATAASASPSPVTGTTTSLSVLGADLAGESALTYTWTTASAPAGAPTPSFSANGTNAAKNDVATFHKAGNYTFTVTMTNLAGLSTTSSVNVTVNQTLTSVTISPTTAYVSAGKTQQFTATGLDQFGVSMSTQPTFTWTLTSGGGTLSSKGLYTAPATGTVAIVTATTGTFSARATVDTLSAPWSSADVGSPGAAGAAYDSNGTFTVLGAGTNVASTADAFHFAYQPVTGDASIIARVASQQNTNASAQAGVIIRNDLTAGSAEALMAITPSSGAAFVSRATSGGTVTSATTSGPKAPYWVKLVRSGNTFTGYYSPDGVTWTQEGSATITMGGTVDIGLAVSSNSDSTLNTSTFNQVSIDTSPTVATAASASPNPVTGTTTSLSVLGADLAGESALTYTWATTSMPAGAPAPTFSANGTNAAKNDVATFGQAGNYTFTVTITDPVGFTTASSVNVTVAQTVTAIAVTPASATVSDGATQTFNASASDQFGLPLSSQPAFTWSVDAGGVGGTVDASGDYTAPASGIGGDTVRASSSSVSGTASVSVTAGSSAVFAGTDATTQGHWRTGYGGDGYDIEGDSSATNPSLPSYASVSVTGNYTYTWGTNTGSPLALQNAAANGDIAATWFSPGTFNINVGINDGKAHLVTLYALDWDQLQGWNVPRSEQIDVLDAATGTVLDTRTLSSFQGEYVSWNISGNVTIRVTNLVAGNNAVIGGIFFGSAASSSSNSAAFVGTDATTQGHWRTGYGGDGYDIEGDSSGTDPNLPSYANVSVTGNYTYTWGTNTGSPYALQNAAANGDIAATWFSPGTFNINVGINDGKAHLVTLYALDWDQLQGWNVPRSEQIDVLDAATGTVLDTRTLSSFQGEYVSWNISGNVTIRVTNLVAGNNAVVAGIFFGGAAQS